MAQGDYLGIVMQSDIGAQGANGVAPLVSPALTGTPTAPTAADGTATAQIATTAFVQSANKWHSNPNLLDNWYFVGGGSQQGGGQFPINQRGQTSYTGTDYGIDRWRSSQGFSSTVTINSGYIHLNKYFFSQAVENYERLFGKRVTMSIVACGQGNITYSIGTSNIGTVYINSDEFELYYSTFDIPNSGDTGQAVISTSTGIDIQAVKLELGNKSTLAHQENGVLVLNEVPNYQEQLFRCQTSKADASDTYANKIIQFNEIQKITIRDTSPTLSLIKTGNVCQLFSFCDSNVEDGALVATLPEAFRPETHLDHSWANELDNCLYFSGSSRKTQSLSLLADGTVMYRNPDGTATWGFAKMMYICKNT